MTMKYKKLQFPYTNGYQSRSLNNSNIRMSLKMFRLSGKIKQLIQKKKSRINDAYPKDCNL